MTLVQTTPGDFRQDQIDLIKSTVAAGTTDLELQLFLEVCKSTGLNPFQRQIYAIKRKTGREEKMTIQTGIDGYRLIAARSGVHLGTTDAEYGPITAEGFPEWARVIVRKLVHGQVAEFPATARWSEYVQQKDEWVNNQRTGKKTVTDMWAKMPHTMLGKCAEALALRKAFPAELSGVYSDVEMQQADNAAPVQVEKAPQKAQDNRAAWEKVQEMASRVRKVAPGREVSDIADVVFVDDHLETLTAAYTALVDLGKQYAPKKQEPAPETPAETMATAEQIKALQAIARTAGATTSEQRAVLWAHSLSSTTPIHTKELNDAQAAGLLGMFDGLGVDERKQLHEEAKREMAGRLV